MIKKSQLIVGDIVLLRLGYRYVVCDCPSGIRLLNNCGWMPFDDYSEELEYHSVINPEEEEAWNVIRVYRPDEEFRKVFSVTNNRLDRHYDIIKVIEMSREITHLAPFDENNNFINISLYV